MSSKSTKASPEQMRYANILSMGAWGGIVLLFVTYIIYLSGIMGAHVPMQDVIANWDKGVDEYMHITNSPHGWAWLSLIHEGDFLNFIGIAVLALMTIVCYFTLIPGYLKKGNKIYAGIVIAEIIVLTVAASGILGSGGH